jgi:hypothetical protein
MAGARFCGMLDCGRRCEFEWDTQWSRVTSNRAGTSGWARVIQNFGSPLVEGHVLRVHRCAQQPCTARWEASKYSVQGPPTHVARVASAPGPPGDISSSGGTLVGAAVAAPAPCFDLPAPFALCTLAAASGGSAGEATVDVAARTLGGESPALAPLHSTTAVVAAGASVDVSLPLAAPSAVGVDGELSGAEIPVAAAACSLEASLPDVVAVVISEEPNLADEACIPSPPGSHVEPLGSALQRRVPALPLSAAPANVLLSTMVPSSAVAQGLVPQSRSEVVWSKILALTRELRKPHEHVGYIFFVLLGIAKNCRPWMWEGGVRVDLLHVFAPWALTRFPKDCLFDAVACCAAPHDGGDARFVPVSTERPLSGCRHFVAACGLPEAVDCQGNSLEAFYAQRGQAVIATVVDGDCAMDVACLMLGLPQELAERVSLRKDNVS